MDWVAVGSIAAVVSAGAAVSAVLENRRENADGRRLGAATTTTSRRHSRFPSRSSTASRNNLGEVANRRIKIATGGRTQSVTASTDENIDGVYEWIVRLERQGFVSAESIDVRHFNSLEKLKPFLLGERGGTLKLGRG